MATPSTPADDNTKLMLLAQLAEEQLDCLKSAISAFSLKRKQLEGMLASVETRENRESRDNV